MFGLNSPYSINSSSKNLRFGLFRKCGVRSAECKRKKNKIKKQEFKKKIKIKNSQFHVQLWPYKIIDFNLEIKKGWYIQQEGF